MKKWTKAILGAILAAGLCVPFAACGGETAEKPDPQIMAAYELYKEEMLAASATPMTYEQWLNSIKGADGKDGEDGKDGKDGATWLFGSGAPQASAGNNGDFYLDKATYDVYSKASGVWTKQGNIKGANGEEGEDGTNGKDGASWLLGESAPQANAGKDGDFYLNKTNYDLYNKSQGAWTKIGNIKGADGSGSTQTPADGKDGASWLLGDGAPQANAGKDGDFYLDKTAYDLYNKAQGAWTKIGNIKGADGTDGEQGENGASWLLGEGAPQTNAGQNGDFYLDKTAYDLYNKADGAWTKVGNIKGADGSTSTPATEEVTLTFNLNAEGEPVSGMEEFANGMKVEKGSYAELPTPERGGYWFRGWWSSAYEGDVNAGQITNVTPIMKDMTLFARWEKDELQVFGQESINYYAGAENPFVFTFSRTPITREYTLTFFCGENEYTPEEFLNSGITVKANWRENEYGEVQLVGSVTFPLDWKEQGEMRMEFTVEGVTTQIFYYMNSLPETSGMSVDGFNGLDFMQPNEKKTYSGMLTLAEGSTYQDAYFSLTIGNTDKLTANFDSATKPAYLADGTAFTVKEIVPNRVYQFSLILVFNEAGNYPCMLEYYEPDAANPDSPLVNLTSQTTFQVGQTITFENALNFAENSNGIALGATGDAAPIVNVYALYEGTLTLFAEYNGQSTELTEGENTLAFGKITLTISQWNGFNQKYELKMEPTQEGSFSIRAQLKYVVDSNPRDEENSMSYEVIDFEAVRAEQLKMLQAIKNCIDNGNFAGDKVQELKAKIEADIAAQNPDNLQSYLTNEDYAFLATTLASDEQVARVKTETGYTLATWWVMPTDGFELVNLSSDVYSILHDVVTEPEACLAFYVEYLILALPEIENPSENYIRIDKIFQAMMQQPDAVPPVSNEVVAAWKAASDAYNLAEAPTAEQLKALEDSIDAFLAEVAQLMQSSQSA